MAKTIKCAECNDIITDKGSKQRNPCPNCGSLKRNVKITLTDQIKISDSISINVIKRIVKKYPIISFLYFSLTVLSLIIGYIIPGILGLLLAIPLVYFADNFSKEKKDEKIREEHH